MKKFNNENRKGSLSKEVWKKLKLNKPAMFGVFIIIIFLFIFWWNSLNWISSLTPLEFISNSNIYQFHDLDTSFTWLISSAPCFLHPYSRCGGIGRRGGFKIHFSQESGGSSPSTGTICMFSNTVFYLQIFPWLVLNKPIL